VNPWLMQELLETIGAKANKSSRRVWLRPRRRAWVPLTMGTKASKMGGKSSKPAAKGGSLTFLMPYYSRSSIPEFASAWQPQLSCLYFVRSFGKTQPNRLRQQLRVRPRRRLPLLQLLQLLRVKLTRVATILI